MPIIDRAYSGDYFKGYVPYLNVLPYPDGFMEAPGIESLFTINSDIPGTGFTVRNGITYHINEYIVGGNEDKDITFTLKNKTYAGQEDIENEDIEYLVSKRGGIDLNISFEFGNFIKLKSSTNIDFQTNASTKIEYILGRQEISQLVFGFNIPRLNRQVQTKYNNIIVTISFNNPNDYLILTESNV